MTFHSAKTTSVRVCAFLVLFSCAGLSLAQQITTIAGDGVFGYAGDNGPAIQAQIAAQGVAVDRWDNIYLAEPTNHVVRRIDHRTGIITTFAGNGQPGNSGDGGPATSAELNYPYKLAINRTGDVYIADVFGLSVRRVDQRTGIITTVVGTATVAHLNPTDVAFDREENLYIGDDVNFRIWRVDRKTGIITAVVGNGTFAIGHGTGEGGPANEAGFVGSLSIAFGPKGELYVADSLLQNVRRVDKRTNIISTVAGEHESFLTRFPPRAYAGDGGPARDALFADIDAITFDCEGNLTIADALNNRIRQVNRRTGIVTTIAGNGTPGFSGDGGPATQAELQQPRDIAFDSDGNLLIVDALNFRVRLVKRSRRGHHEGCFADDDRHDHDRGW